MNRNIVRRAPPEVEGRKKVITPQTMMCVNADRVKRLMAEHNIKTRGDFVKAVNSNYTNIKRLLDDEICSRFILEKVAKVFGVEWESLVKP